MYAQAQAERPLGWRPELPNAAFPPGYACAGDVVPPELADILQGCEPEDFSQVLQPMTMDDFDALLLHQTWDSTPGITGLTYGHLRASSRKHRLVYLHLVNRVILYQQCPTKLLDVAIALIPKSDGAQGLGAGRPISLIESLMKLATAWVAHRMKSALRAHRRETDPPEPTLPSGRLEEMQGVRGRQSGQRAAQNEQNASSNPHIDAWWASATQAAPEDAYKRLIDACRLAVEEAYTSHGVAIGSYAEAAGSAVPACDFSTTSCVRRAVRG